MFSCYLKKERRQTIRNGAESKTPRYVATAQAGYFKPLPSITNAKNEIVMFYQRNDKCNPNSTAETRLQCKDSVNFSSVYLLNQKLGNSLIGYGEPPYEEFLTPKKVKAKDGTIKVIPRPNPFFDNREDGYLFIISPDFNTIEILVVPQGRQLIRGYAAKLADGQLNEALEQIRQAAKSKSA